MTLFENLIWQHTNGQKYKIVGEAIIEETLEPAIVYQRVGAEPLIWVRPAKVFFERFSPVFPAKAAEPESVHVCIDAKDVEIKVGNLIVHKDSYREGPVRGLKVLELRPDNRVVVLDESGQDWIYNGRDSVVVADVVGGNMFGPKDGDPVNQAAKDEVECLDHNRRPLKVGDTVTHKDDYGTKRAVRYEVEKLQGHGHIRLTGEVHSARASNYIVVP